MQMERKRVVLNLTMNNSDLERGVENLFSENAQALFGAERVVITGLSATALSSDCPASISLAFNIGNGRQDATSALPNSAGELYHPVVTDMSADHMHAYGEFQTCLAVQPLERWRGPPVSMFAPSAGMEERLVAEYGNLSMENLWEGVRCLCPV